MDFRDLYGTMRDAYLNGGTPTESMSKTSVQYTGTGQISTGPERGDPELRVIADSLGYKGPYMQSPEAYREHERLKEIKDLNLPDHAAELDTSYTGTPTTTEDAPVTHPQDPDTQSD